jgi:hypothetical protein
MNMRARCLNQNHPRFHQYGGRGVTICPRWLESFQNFLADMGRKPQPDLTLDRIDPEGNYEPSNCRWISFDANRRNRRAVISPFRSRSPTQKVMAREYVRIREEKRRLRRLSVRDAEVRAVK